MFKIPDITEANEIIETLTPVQIEAFHLVSLYIRNKKLFGVNKACFSRKAKDIKPTDLINLEEELKLLGFEMTVSYENKKYPSNYNEYVFMKINISPKNGLMK